MQRRATLCLLKLTIQAVAGALGLAFVLRAKETARTRVCVASQPELSDSFLSCPLQVATSSRLRSAQTMGGQQIWMMVGTSGRTWMPSPPAVSSRMQIQQVGCAVNLRTLQKAPLKLHRAPCLRLALRHMFCTWASLQAAKGRRQTVSSHLAALILMAVKAFLYMHSCTFDSIQPPLCRQGCTRCNAYVCQAVLLLTICGCWCCVVT